MEIRQISAPTTSPAGSQQGSDLTFFCAFTEASGSAFSLYFASRYSRRGQITEKQKIGWGHGLRGWWGWFWPLAFILGFLGPGWGGVGRLLGVGCGGVLALVRLLLRAYISDRF